MSLMSHIVNDLLEDVTNPLANLYDQHFGLGLCDDDIIFRAPTLLSLIPRRPLPVFRHKPNSIVAKKNNDITDNSDEFKVNVDVQQFKPEEIEVKIVDDYVVIGAKHEEKPDKHGFISRQFIRRYKLPENVNVDDMKSSISSDGILLVTAPKKVEKLTTGVRQIPITQTNQPALKEAREPTVETVVSNGKEN